MNYPTNIRSSIAGTLLIAVLAAAASAQENPIVNGSFEQPPGFAGWDLSHDYIYPFWKRQWDYGGENLFPQNYNHGGCIYMAFNAQQGSHAVNVNSVSLYQIVDVVPGQEYLLSFFVGSYDDGTYPPVVSGWGSLDLAVFQGHNLETSLTPVFAGQQVIPAGVSVTWSRYDNYTPGSHRVHWRPFSYPFIASADQVAFTFQGGGYSFSYYTGLDNVSFVAIPEPSTFSLAATCCIFIGLHLGNRKTRQQMDKAFEHNQRFEATAANLSVSTGCGGRTLASVPHPQR